MNATATILQSPTSTSTDLQDRKCFEIVDGVRVQIRPMNVEAAVVASQLAFHVSNFAIPNDIGEVIVNALFRLPLPMDRNRRPRVALVPLVVGRKTNECPHRMPGMSCPTSLPKSSAPLIDSKRCSKKSRSIFSREFSWCGLCIPSSGLSMSMNRPRKFRF